MKRIFVPGHYRLRLKRSKTGRGVFAEERIPKGACIIEYTGRPATKKQLATNKGKYLFWTSKTTMIDGNIAGNLARFINHSCAPNCEVDIKNRRVFVFARRNLAAGEELIFDYGDEHFNDYIKPIGCRCVKCDRMKA
ncbi:MAG: hypothetical protein RL681_745 [Candidatus Parcubacteria bacterium]|jgi:SET domain-containing protein